MFKFFGISDFLHKELSKYNLDDQFDNIAFLKQRYLDIAFDNSFEVVDFNIISASEIALWLPDIDEDGNQIGMVTLRK